VIAKWAWGADKKRQGEVEKEKKKKSGNAKKVGSREGDVDSEEGKTMT